MAVSVKQISLWRGEVPNRPGALAGVLGPLAQSGADLEVVMAYRIPGDQDRAAIEVYPVSGRKAARAADQASLEDSRIPALLINGEDRPGLGYAIARSIGDAGINMIFLIAQVVGRRYSAIIGFETAAEAKRAATLVRRAKPSTRGK